MLSSILLYSGEKMSWVGTVVVFSCSDSKFIKVGDCSIIFFNEYYRFGKINSKPLIDSPIFSEYLSGNGHSRLSWYIICTFVDDSDLQR